MNNISDLTTKCKLFQKNELQTFTKDELSCITNLNELRTVLAVIPPCYEAIFLFQMSDEQWREIVNQNELNELHLLMRQFFFTNLEGLEKNKVLTKILKLWEASYKNVYYNPDCPDFRHPESTTIHELVPVEGAKNWFINAIPEENLQLFSDALKDILYRQNYLSKTDKAAVAMGTAMASFLILSCLSMLALILALTIAGLILLPSVSILATVGIAGAVIAASGIVGTIASLLLGTMAWIGLTLFYHVPQLPEDLEESLSDVKLDKVRLLSSVLTEKISNPHSIRFFKQEKIDQESKLSKYLPSIHTTHYC